ncbi:MAG TPA: hypothetical protein VN843_01160 [Anaerolineales bacterium]|jgi:hypothetical protein|nr:hypothetical protein [Anaerolineales bacterium]
MKSEDKNQNTQERQDDSNAPETAERKRISRLADELAQRAKKRQVDYEGHKIFTK